MIDDDNATNFDNETANLDKFSNIEVSKNSKNTSYESELPRALSRLGSLNFSISVRKFPLYLSKTGLID